jgi:uncharacterized cupin superfamily protein
MSKAPLNLSLLEHQELRSAKTGEKFSLSSTLSTLLGFKNLFIHHEIIPPGRRSSSPHWHTHREEMVLVLEGNPTVHHAGKSLSLKPMDFVGFPPGEENLHVVENRTDAEVRLLVIASNPPADEIVTGNQR